MKPFAAGAILGVAFLLAGCAGTTQANATDLTLALDVAATARGVYAARPDADPKVVAELARLLAAAQAAVASYQTSTSPADQAAAQAAISALVAYEASAQPSP
jgi:hypothetical protein